MSNLDYIEITHYGALTVAAFTVFKWLYKKARNAEIEHNFVEDMALNHLPHIQEALTTIAEYIGIRLKPAPPVQFIKLSGDEKGE